MQSGFEISAYLRKKATLTIEVLGTPIRAQEDARRMGLPEAGALIEAAQGVKTAKKSTSGASDAQEVPSDILHPELYERIRAWRNAEAERQNLPVYMVLQQKAILGISNLLPIDKEMLLRIPFIGKKGVEKYGEVVLEMVRAYREEKGLKDSTLL